jgi:hypothetical protein
MKDNEPINVSTTQVRVLQADMIADMHVVADFVREEMHENEERIRRIREEVETISIVAIISLCLICIMFDFRADLTASVMTLPEIAVLIYRRQRKV